MLRAGGGFRCRWCVWGEDTPALQADDTPPPRRHRRKPDLPLAPVDVERARTARQYGMLPGATPTIEERQWYGEQFDPVADVIAAIVDGEVGYAGLGVYYRPEGPTLEAEQRQARAQHPVMQQRRAVKRAAREAAHEARRQAIAAAWRRERARAAAARAPRPAPVVAPPAPRWTQADLALWQWSWRMGGVVAAEIQLEERGDQVSLLRLRELREAAGW
jgi:hypothetical protein